MRKMTVSVPLTEETRQALWRASERLERSVSWCVRQAVSKWLREDCGGLSRQASDG